MTSYEFYVCKYKAIQPDEWRTAYADADALIQRYERLYRVGYPTDSARDTAVCAIADAQQVCRAGMALWLLRPALRLAACCLHRQHGSSH